MVGTPHKKQSIKVLSERNYIEFPTTNNAAIREGENSSAVERRGNHRRGWDTLQSSIPSSERQSRTRNIADIVRQANSARNDRVHMN